MKANGSVISSPCSTYYSRCSSLRTWPTILWRSSTRECRESQPPLRRCSARLHLDMLSEHAQFTGSRRALVCDVQAGLEFDIDRSGEVLVNKTPPMYQLRTRCRSHNVAMKLLLLQETFCRDHESESHYSVGERSVCYAGFETGVAAMAV